MQQIFAALCVFIVFSILLGLRYWLADRPAKNQRIYRAYLVKLTNDKDDFDRNDDVANSPQELETHPPQPTITILKLNRNADTNFRHFFLQEIA